MLGLQNILYTSVSTVLEFKVMRQTKSSYTRQHDTRAGQSPWLLKTLHRMFNEKRNADNATL